MQRDLGPTDIEEWVLDNAERVQNMRDLAVANLTAASDQRKQSWDNTAQIRQFNKGDKVYIRRSTIMLEHQTVRQLGGALHGRK